MTETNQSAIGRIETRTEGNIGWIVIANEARKNAISGAMFRALLNAVTAFEADDRVRVIVLRGAGNECFSAGADLTEVSALDRSEQEIARFEDALFGSLSAVETCRKPTIAMLQGFWIGGASALAMSCDLRVASDDSRFALTPAKHALAYDYKNTKKLVDLVGPGFAKEILMTARQFSAAETLAMGLVNKVVPKAELEPTVLDYARRISANAPLSVLVAKHAVAAVMRDEDGKDVSDVEASIDAAQNSADAEEGKRAFLEKRPPRYTGR
jgi:enoyl-CoA hydratase